MALFNIFSSEHQNPKDKIKAAKDVFDRQIKSLKDDIERSKQQIQTLKDHTAMIKKKGNLTPGDKSAIQSDKRRIGDWKKKIQRRKDDIAREKTLFKKHFK